MTPHPHPMKNLSYVTRPQRTILSVWPQPSGIGIKPQEEKQAIVGLIKLRKRRKNHPVVLILNPRTKM